MLFSTTNSFKLNDRALSSPGTIDFGSILNSGIGEVNLGVTTRAANVRSNGPVTLRSNSLVDGVVSTPSTVSMQQGASITGATLHPARIDPEVISWNVNFPQGTLPSISLEPGQTANKLPGNYDAVTVKSNATLTFHSGAYTLRSLDLEPQSRLVMDKSAGPISIYVRDSMIYRGTYVEGPGRAGNYLVGVASAATTFIQAPYTGGTLIAPFGKLDFASVAAPNVHRGSFFGLDVEVHEGSVVQHQPSGALLQFPPLGGFGFDSLTLRTCGATGGITCPAGQFQLSSALNLLVCKAPLAAGAACGASDICPAGQACTNGVCAAASNLGDICNTGTPFDAASGLPLGVTFPNANAPCAYDFNGLEPTYCGAIDPPKVANGVIVAVDPTHRVCRHFQHIGDPCDNPNLSSIPDPRRCETGLTCNAGSSAQGECIAQCTSTADCPCGISCNTGAGTCAFCRPNLNDPCSLAPGDGCCNPQMGCSEFFTNGVDNVEPARIFGDGECKLLPGQGCTSDNDCQYHSDTPLTKGPPRHCVSGTCTAQAAQAGASCSMKTQVEACGPSLGGCILVTATQVARDDYCATGLVCDTASFTCLAKAGQSCTANSQCANGLVCAPNLTCQKQCIAGASCTTNLKGECKAGTQHCDSANVETCVANKQPATETCNGLDDDCNGAIDDNIAAVGTACTTMPSGCNGATEPGTQQCSGTGTAKKLTCVGKECNVNDDSLKGSSTCYCPGTNSGPCGDPATTPCNGANFCTAGAACSSGGVCSLDPTMPCCNIQCTAPMCFTPSQLKSQPLCAN
jgi:hypothetical protein